MALKRGAIFVSRSEYMGSIVHCWPTGEPDWESSIQKAKQDGVIS
jgi:hypothetical protein